MARGGVKDFFQIKSMCFQRLNQGTKITISEVENDSFARRNMATDFKSASYLPQATLGT